MIRGRGRTSRLRSGLERPGVDVAEVGEFAGVDGDPEGPARFFPRGATDRTSAHDPQHRSAKNAVTPGKPGGMGLECTPP